MLLRHNPLLGGSVLTCPLVVVTDLMRTTDPWQRGCICTCQSSGCWIRLKWGFCVVVLKDLIYREALNGPICRGSLPGNFKGLKEHLKQEMRNMNKWNSLLLPWLALMSLFYLCMAALDFLSKRCHSVRKMMCSPRQSQTDKKTEICVFFAFLNSSALT